ncbi:PREDICTED: mono [ADP-ribose] polymerase PARP16 [Polistes dominula]|uniref:Poly [ADP-ribose] polymerase n=1 Tax=Polistes dominula TaxID=743375 RepID=A0ABM1I6X3_POLDO|nr:PREDICTED: mono [ADP-ribose] polymerase PARP16 [Polistes dominula]
MECMEKSHQMNAIKSKCNNKMDINKEDKSLEMNLDILHSTKMDTTPYQDDADKKIVLLKHLLEKDPKAADLKWSLFVAACNTYRCDTCLRPFPPMYVKNECKDIEALRKTVELIPPLAVILRELHEPNVYANYGPAIDLLHWVLIRLRDPYIKSISKDNYDSVLKKIPSEMQVAPPNLIFQVASAKQSTAEEKWKSNGQGYSTLYAYHGSRLENFHSILHYGLQQNMCKKSLYGKGIYLSSELGVSLPYSPVGYGWGGSVLGSELSCVALCELINHPAIKKHNPKARIQNTSSESVPNKYYLVTNSDLVRIRYLLVYSQEVQPTRNDESSGLLEWFRQHKLLTFMLGYVILLASVGLTHNKQVEKYYRLLVQKTGLD